MRCRKMYQSGPGRKEMIPSKEIMEKIKGLLTMMQTEFKEINKTRQSILELTTQSHYHSLVLRRQGKGESLGTFKRFNCRKGSPDGSYGLWGKIAVTSKVTWQGRSQGDKYPSLSPPLNFLQAITLEDPSEPQGAGIPEMLSEKGSLLGHRAG